MKSENGIKNRWKLLEETTNIIDIKHRFNAYSWYNDEHLRISREEYWCGWWNNVFNFVSVFPKDYHGKILIRAIRKSFADNGYTIKNICDNGISIMYMTMTKEESDEKARRNLLNGGRMSD